MSDNVRLIARFLLFALLLFCGHLLFSYAYTGLVLTRTLLVRNEREFRAYTGPLAIMVIGDSHGGFAVEPEILGDSFNVSSNGENSIQTYYKLETLLDEGYAPNLLILPLDLHSFSSYRTDRFDDNHYWRRYLDYVELGRYKGDLPYYLSLALEGQFPYLGAEAELINFINGEYERRETRRGQIRTTNQFSERTDAAQNVRARVNLFTRDSNLLDPDLIDYFQRLLQLADAHEIQVVLVRYPVTAEYHTLAASVMDISAYEAAVADIVTSAGVDNILLLNYHEAYYGQNHLFADADHLNVDGARIFTAQLRQDLVKAGLITDQPESATTSKSFRIGIHP